MLLWVGFYVELLNSFYDMRPALPDFYRNDPCLHFGGFEAQEGHRQSGWLWSNKKLPRL